MKLDDEKYELIRKYLDSELSENEKVAFEQELKNSEELREELNLFEWLPQYIGEGEIPNSEIDLDHPKVKAYLKEYLSEESKDLAATLEEVGSAYITKNSITNEPTQATTSKWKIFRAAAAILILLGCAWFLMQPTSPSKLYSNYVVHEDIILNQRGENEQLLKDAEMYFNAKEYEKAAPLLDQIYQNEVNYDVLLALGIAYLEQGEFQSAMEQFNAIYDSNSIIKDKALWYQAATFLKQGDKQNALAKLQQLQNEYPYYKAEETKLLIKKLK